MVHDLSSNSVGSKGPLKGPCRGPGAELGGGGGPGGSEAFGFLSFAKGPERLSWKYFFL